MDTRFARLAFGALLIAFGAILVLHGFQPGRDIVHEPISFYWNGRQGWLLPFALAAFGAAALALGNTVRQVTGSRWAETCIVAFGGGMLVDAVFPCDQWFPWQAAPTVSGVIHALAAVVAPPLLLVPMWRLYRRQGRPSGLSRFIGSVILYGYLGGLLGSAWSLVAGFVADDAPPFIGVAERVLALCGVAWFGALARSVGRD